MTDFALIFFPLSLFVFILFYLFPMNLQSGFHQRRKLYSSLWLELVVQVKIFTNIEHMQRLSTGEKQELRHFQTHKYQKK